MQMQWKVAAGAGLSGQQLTNTCAAPLAKGVEEACKTATMPNQACQLLAEDACGATIPTTAFYKELLHQPLNETCLPLEEDARGVAAARLDRHVLQLGHTGREGKGHRAAGGKLRRGFAENSGVRSAG